MTEFWFVAVIVLACALTVACVWMQYDWARRAQHRHEARTRCEQMRKVRA